MKNLTEFLIESINESNEISTFQKLIDNAATQRKIMKDSRFDEDVVSYALSYIEASIDAMVDEHGDEWKKYMAEWVSGDFAEVFAEYMVDEMGYDEEFANEDLTPLVNAIQKHLGLS